jgi:DNA-binding SARP family transcriptional activator
MEFQILGSMQVFAGSRRVTVPAGRGRALLALLILNAGQVVSMDAIIDALWGERPPSTAGAVVQNLVSRLRRVLEPDRDLGGPAAIVQRAGAGYRLAADPQDIDAQRFVRLVAHARERSVRDRARLLGEALRLWRGPALAEFLYEPFAQTAMTSLEEMRLAALEDRINADLALSRHGTLIAEIEELVQAHPFREHLRGQLMLALYRSGRQADALVAYRSAREALTGELGLEPGQALRDLEQAILRQDKSLAAPGPISEPAHRESAQERPWFARERRIVTVLVTAPEVTGDIAADPEVFEQSQRRVVEAAREVLRRHGARVEETATGTVLGLFGLPAAHEDDAVRAVRAATELNTAAGIDTGDVLVGAPSAVSGPVIAAAARLHQAAAPRQILIGDQTHRLVQGAVVVKPRRDIGAWMVAGIVPDAAPLTRWLGSPMHGRQSELSHLRATLRRAMRAGKAVGLTIVGEAGIGKSRLAKEFADSIRPDARVITGRCPPYGEGITFLPLREALLDAAGPGGWPALAELVGPAGPDQSTQDNGEALRRVASAIGLAPPAQSAYPLFPAIRLVLERIAARHPLVVILDDMHWATPTFRELVEYVSQTARGRIFLLCLARPELAEQSPESPNTLTLEPLSADEVAEIVADRASMGLEKEDIDRIAATARGNPLFAEQLVAASGDSHTGVIPPTLQGLLAMRLDRLGPGERDVLRCAAIVGTDWDVHALTALLPEQARPHLDRHILTLRQRQLIDAIGPEGYQFRHVLIQLAAYRSMTRQDRARLHERFADWLEASATRLPDLEEVAGYHLEQAVKQAVDGPVPELATRAGHHLANAAQHAHERFDLTAVENLLSRARTLLPQADPRRLTVTQRLAETDLVLGRHREGQRLLQELIARADAAGDTSSAWAARLEWARIQSVIGPDPLSLQELRAQADQAEAFYASAGDDSGLCQALFLRGCVLLLQGRLIAANQAFRDGIGLADRSGLVREEVAHRWMLAETLTLGPTPVPDCLEICQHWASNRGFDNPGILTQQAALLAMQGRFDDAWQMNDQARQIFVERMHVRRMLRFVAQSNAFVYLLAGYPVEAEREFKVAVDLTSEMGEREPLALAAAGLSTALARQGRVGDAAHYAALSRRAAPAQAVMAQALSRAAAARCASASGDHSKAQQLARQAVRRAPTEMPNVRADVLSVEAEILRTSGQADAARQTAARALALYERKGNTVLAARTAADHSVT